MTIFFRKMTLILTAGIILLSGMSHYELKAETNRIGSGDDDSQTSGRETSTKIGGYGEVILSDDQGGPNRNITFRRFIIYLNHNFNNWISFRSELEFEKGAELALEQAYLNLRVDQRLVIRSGLLIIPLSVINLFHEPTTFNTVDRPLLDRTLVPSTWREFGAGITGRFSNGLKYQLFLTAGLNSEKFSGNNFIRKGRQGAGALENGGSGTGKASVQNVAVSARLDYVTPVPGLQFGMAVYRGGTDNRSDGLKLNAPLTIISLDGRYQWGLLELKGQFAWDKLQNAARINTVNRLSGTEGVAEKAYGYYLSASYNILAHIVPESEQTLAPFAFFEKVNNHAAVPANVTRNKAYNSNNWRIGMAYKPTYNVIFKFAFTFTKTEEIGSKWIRAFRLGLGYNF